MQFKTYGSAMDSLAKSLNAAVRGLDRPDENYFVQRNLILHREFQVWCSKHGLSEFENVYNALKEHHKMYHSSSTLLHVLFTTLPKEFNVRGNWTAEDTTIVVETC